MHLPLATYRLQLSRSFPFRKVETLLPYLSQLGISDIYASPIFKATEGSTHGYDVTDPNQLNPELGTPEEFGALMQTRQSLGLGWLQDIVPNHMAYSPQNAMLMDLFENGPQSPSYPVFDIFWDHPDPELQTKVLAPFLGRPWLEALKDKEIKLVLDLAGLAWRYYHWRFALSLRSYAIVLGHTGDRFDQALQNDTPLRTQFLELCDMFEQLSHAQDSPSKRSKVKRCKRDLFGLYQEHDPIRRHIDDRLRSFNTPEDTNLLNRLLEEQFFKPAFWQTAAQCINYRRFFYLNDFIALRLEVPEVFEKVHGGIAQLVKDGSCTGLRIDHLDGLYAPRAYLKRLRRAFPEIYLVTEKILEPEESLPLDWPIQGASGYKFCAYVNGVFCQGQNEAAFTGIYHDFTGATFSFEAELFDTKKQILETHMAGEIAYLTHLFDRACPETCEHLHDVSRGLVALMAAFPVYRTYIDEQPVTLQDREILETAIACARARAPGLTETISSIGALLKSYALQEKGTESNDSLRHFVMRFQQFTGPAMAKGFEDTLLYVYHRFVSLNEVGGDPASLGLSLERFHAFNVQRAQAWPHAMNATSTHDAKRGEDVRARLNVLSEIPQRWRETVTRWARINQPYHDPIGDQDAPDRNDEYLIYQTLIGAWPFDPAEQAAFPDRLRGYLLKAVREAKIHSSWIQPNEPYEAACLGFIDRMFDRTKNQAFWDDFLRFQQDIACYGVYNSLSQTLLKMTCPGIPDFYQGAELWDLNLVDPDNRRPVDFQKRGDLLDNLKSVAGIHWTEALLTPQDGNVKLFLISRILHARAQHKTLFDHGDYLPLETKGKWRAHVISFLRRHEGTCALTVVPRFLASIVAPGTPPVGRAVWQDTKVVLPKKVSPYWYNVLTKDNLPCQEEQSVGDMLSSAPVALLLNAQKDV